MQTRTATSVPSSVATSILLLSLVCLVGCATSSSPQEDSGVASKVAPSTSDLPAYERLPVPAPHRPRDLQASLWYPGAPGGYRTRVGDNAAFEGVDARQGTRPLPQDGDHPLVLISHGSGGNIDGLAWLASTLAQAGYLVAGVNHPGTTSGDSSPRRTVEHWRRADDLSALLDELESDSTFGPLIDQQRITVLGFSLGGLTALSAGGARLSADAFETYCTEDAPGRVGCRYLERGGVAFDALERRPFEQDLRDVRIDSVIAIDPAFSYVMTTQSLDTMTIPVQLINLGTADARWPAIDVSRRGSALATRLPDVDYAVVKAANHFTFLGICKPGAPDLLIQEGEDPICDDPEGVDRATSHASISALIVKFLERQGTA